MERDGLTYCDQNPLPGSGLKLKLAGCETAEGRLTHTDQPHDRNGLFWIWRGGPLSRLQGSKLCQADQDCEYPRRRR